MPDPVSWKLVERGWDVVGRDGAELGSVHEVLGDADADIFNGLHVSRGILHHSRYVPSERVLEIVEGQVRLDVDEAGFERLDHAEAVAPQREIRSDTTDLGV